MELFVAHLSFFGDLRSIVHYVKETCRFGDVKTVDLYRFGQLCDGGRLDLHWNHRATADSGILYIITEPLLSPP